jgi:Terpene cyclase DEP1
MGSFLVNICARILRMNAKRLYFVLCLIGAAVPYAAFVPWVVAHGLNVRLFWQELQANRISMFFVLDVVVSAIVVIAFASVERDRIEVRHKWAVTCALLLVGVSLALPLFLYLREAALSATQKTALASKAGD